MNRSRRIASVGAAAALSVLLPACTDDTGAQEPTAEEYLEQLDAICADTTAALDALPTPPEEITVADFAAEASSALTDEAERMRGLDSPTELDADHRALIANTDEQAAAWLELGGLGASDAEGLEALSTRIGELTLGRSDLAAAMGADACVRAVG